MPNHYVHIEQEVNREEKQVFREVEDYVKSKKAMKLGRVMCSFPEFKTNCRL